MYADSDQDRLPWAKWPIPPGRTGPSGNPWTTYEAYRVLPGSATILEGPFNLGHLFESSTVPDARIFYCPSGKNVAERWTYGYYTRNGAWPSTPAGSDDDNIRAGYSYYPQSRKEELLGRGLFVPEVARKTSELDVNKSMTTDLLHDLAVAPHRNGPRVAGLNALFGDGHISYNHAKSNPTAFTEELWTDIGGDAFRFRYAMSLWKP